MGRNLADLTRREADIAFRIVNPQQTTLAPDYIAHKAGSMSAGLYTTEAALQKAGDWKNLEVVSWDESWIKLPMVEWLAQLFPGREPALRTNSMQTQYTAIRAGLGATFLPRFIGDNDPALQRVDAGELETERELWLLYHRDLKGSQRVLAMRDFVAEICQQVLVQKG